MALGLSPVQGSPLKSRCPPLEALLMGDAVAQRRISRH